MDNQEFFKRTLEEITNLKQYATKEEINKLDFTDLNPNLRYSCIYGQMTGNCWSPRALELITLCCFYKDEMFNNIPDWDEDNPLECQALPGDTCHFGKDSEEQENYNRAFSYLEVSIACFPNLENEQKYNTPFGKITIQSIDTYANNSGKIYTISDYGIMIFNTKEFIQNIILQKFVLLS